MAAMSDFTGYVASTLVLVTFMTKDMRLLRVFAILSNLAFISYGAIAWLPPVLGLHLLLLPLNILRLREIITTQPALRSATPSHPTSSPSSRFCCNAACIGDRQAVACGESSQSPSQA